MLRSTAGLLLSVVAISCAEPLVPPQPAPRIGNARLVVLPGDAQVSGSLTSSNEALALRFENMIQNRLATRGYAVRQTSSEERRRDDIGALVSAMRSELGASAVALSATNLARRLDADLLIDARLRGHVKTGAEVTGELLAAGAFGIVGALGMMAADTPQSGELALTMIDGRTGAVLWRRTETTSADVQGVGLDALVEPIFVRFPPPEGVVQRVAIP